MSCFKLRGEDLHLNKKSINLQIIDILLSCLLYKYDAAYE